LHSGNDPKSGKLSAGMGGRFHPESVATLFRNGWQVWTGICTYHQQWFKTLERGFECRFVYYIIKTFKWVFVISFILTFLIFLINFFEIKTNVTIIDAYFQNHSDLSNPIYFTVTCFIVYILFLVCNYPSKKKPRGCFFKYNEINQLNIDWIKDNISSKDDFKNYDDNDHRNA